MFTIGDECCHQWLSTAEIRRIFGDESPALKAAQLFREASETYEIFHIVMKAGSYDYQKSGEHWHDLIGNRAVELSPDDLDVLPEIFVSLMQHTRDIDKQQILAQWEGKAATVVKEILDGMGADFHSILTKLLLIREHYTKIRLAGLQTAYQEQFCRPEIRK